MNGGTFPAVASRASLAVMDGICVGTKPTTPFLCKDNALVANEKVVMNSYFRFVVVTVVLVKVRVD